MNRWNWPVISPPDPGIPQQPLLTRLLWMAVIWTASVVVLLAIAMMLRRVLQTT